MRNVQMDLEEQLRKINRNLLMAVSKMDNFMAKLDL